MNRLLIILAACAFIASCERPLTQPPDKDTPPVGDPIDPPEEETPDLPADPVDPTDDTPLIDSEGRTFSYRPAGDLENGSAPNDILVDDMIYDDQIVFPAESAVFLNSQVYGHGGSQAALNGKTTVQCHDENYNYPWRDNFCEKRGKDQYFCQNGGHTGVDIRPASCEKAVHWAVAPEAGEIYDIGSYGVRLMADDGTWYQFLHLDMANLAVVEGQEVSPGQRIGTFSNVFFDSNGDPVPTTIHMHLDMKEAYSPSNGEDPFIDRVNPYMTLVAAYERKLLKE